MNEKEYKDIVEEVFDRTIKEDDRVSALFANNKSIPDVMEKEARSFLDSKGRPETAVGSPCKSTTQTVREVANNQSGSDNNEFVRKVRTPVIAGLGVIILGLFAGGYFLTLTTATTKPVSQVPDATNIETFIPVIDHSVSTAEAETVAAESGDNFPAVNWKPVIHWSGLLNEISSSMPRSVQLCVVKSVDGTEMLLDGKAISSDAVRHFVETLKDNSQIESAELTATGIAEMDAEGLLTFSVSCVLGSTTERGEGNENRLFSSAESKQFFSNIQSELENNGCDVSGFLVSGRDGLFGDGETNGLIIKQHAGITIAGSFQDIFKAFEILQNRLQCVWFDSVSIKVGGETGELECKLGISVYSAEYDG